jgi:hypothetical protein
MKTLMVALASRISVSLFLPVDMESDFSSSNINVCICGAQKGSSKDEGCLYVLLHVKHHEID